MRKRGDHSKSIRSEDPRIGSHVGQRASTPPPRLEKLQPTCLINFLQRGLVAFKNRTMATTIRLPSKHSRISEVHERGYVPVVVTRRYTLYRIWSCTEQYIIGGREA